MAASLLIFNIEQADLSPGTYLYGEIVEVQDFGFDWGTRRLDYFAIFDITDKTPAEVSNYMDEYNRLIDMQVIAGPNPEGLRRINVRNNLVSTSGTYGGWDAINTSNIITEWTSLYPESGLKTIEIFTDKNPNDVWQCEGVFGQGQYEQFEAVVIDKGLGSLVKRRRWAVTESGMSQINGQPDAHWSGTAQQFSQIVQDSVAT